MCCVCVRFFFFASRLRFLSEGVRVRHPHGHHVWTQPESAAARDGLATGVPLGVALEGERADRFRLDVTSCAGTDGCGGGGFRRASNKGVRSVLSRGRGPRSTYNDWFRLLVYMPTATRGSPSAFLSRSFVYTAGSLPRAFFLQALSFFLAFVRFCLFFLVLAIYGHTYVCPSRRAAIACPTAKAEYLGTSLPR